MDILLDTFSRYRGGYHGRKYCHQCLGIRLSTGSGLILPVMLIVGYESRDTFVTILPLSQGGLCRFTKHTFYKSSKSTLYLEPSATLIS